MYVKNINFEIYINICKKISYYYKFMIFKLQKQEHNNSDTASISSSCESEENIEPPLKRQKCFVETEMYKRLQRPNVCEILKKNEQGRLILQNYSQTTIKVFTTYSC